MTVSAFDLPDRLAAKRDPALIAGDEQHFAAIEASLDRTVSDLTRRLDVARRQESESGGEQVEQDMEVRRLESRLRTLGRFGLDLALGPTNSTPPWPRDSLGSE